MSYLSISNFWKYQNADVWKKSTGHPPWFKHYVHRDRELDKLDPMARLLFYELLGAATRHKNVLDSDSKWLFTETLMAEEEIAKHLPVLLNGGWVRASDTPKRSRKPSRKIREKPLDLKDKEEDLPPYPHAVGGGSAQTPRGNGTNPRARAEQAKRQTALTNFVAAFINDYSEEAMLEELTQRGCRQDEALDLLAAERATHQTEVA